MPSPLPSSKVYLAKCDSPGVMENTPVNVVSIDAMMQSKVIMYFLMLFRVSSHFNGYSIISGFGGSLFFGFFFALT